MAGSARQRANHGRSWLATIAVQRIDIADHLADNPSLAPYIPEAMARAWKAARAAAAQESGLPISTFPEQCPYSWEQALNEDWVPE